MIDHKTSWTFWNKSPKTDNRININLSIKLKHFKANANSRNYAVSLQCKCSICGLCVHGVNISNEHENITWKKKKTIWSEPVSKRPTKDAARCTLRKSKAVNTQWRSLIYIGWANNIRMIQSFRFFFALRCHESQWYPANIHKQKIVRLLCYCRLWDKIPKTTMKLQERNEIPKNIQKTPFRTAHTSSVQLMRCLRLAEKKSEPFKLIQRKGKKTT